MMGRWIIPALVMFAAVAAVFEVAGAAPLGKARACKAYGLIDDVTGETIVGAEDLAIDRAGGVVYVSAYDRRAVRGEISAGGPVTTQGGIYRFDLPDGLPEGSTIPVRDLSRTFKETNGFHPHGFHFRDGDVARLHVVNHVYEFTDGKAGDNPAIERFRLGAGALVHEATIRPGPNEPVMCSPNDLWAKSDGTFYVSNDHGACAGFGRAWEETLALKGSYLLYYDGAKFRKVAEKLKFANGVTGRKNAATGARLIIVSETRGKKLRVYDEADLLDPRTAMPIHTIKLKGSPDNLDWTEDGDLLAATIPNIVGMGIYMRGWFGKKKTASRTQRIPWTADGPGEPEIVFEDDGEMIAGATVITGARGLYFIGAAFDDNIVICPSESAE